MAEAVIEVQTKPLDEMNVKELRIECRNKAVKYSDMNKAQMLQALRALAEEIVADGQPMEVAAEAAVEEAPAEPEQPKSPWDGFLPELASVCSAFEELEEGHFLPEDLLQVVTAAREGKTVADFDQFSEEELQAMINTLRNQLPRYQREVFETIGLISAARPMVIDVDFI